MESAHWRIVEDDLSGHDIRTLLEIHFAGMRANSPVGSCHFLDFEGLKADNVTFWSIWDGHDLAGCGALKQLDDTHGELKSMRTAEAHLGRRVGARMLTHILEDAPAATRGSAWRPARASHSLLLYGCTRTSGSNRAARLATTSTIRLVGTSCFRSDGRAFGVRRLARPPLPWR
jgi:GNAT superfamily N-acetyltransferase